LSDAFENDYAPAAVEAMKAVMAGWPDDARWNYFLAAVKFVHRAE
jgi:hypothetical protein